MTTENAEDLTITEGEGRLIKHTNGDVTIVPDSISDEDADAIAQLDGADIAEAIEARATEAAKEAAAEEREKATAEVLDHPEDVNDREPQGTAGRTDPEGVKSDLDNSDRTGAPAATGDQGDAEQRDPATPATPAGPSFTG